MGAASIPLGDNMSLQRTAARNIDLRETNLARVFASKQTLNTVSPVMALHGNNPSRAKSIRKGSHKHQQLVKAARWITACLIVAAGGPRRTAPTAPTEGVKLDEYHRRTHARGTSLHAPNLGSGERLIQFAVSPPKKKPGKSHTAKLSTHQRIVLKARQQEKHS
jgi:hypothetical protein